MLALCATALPCDRSPMFCLPPSRGFGTHFLVPCHGVWWCCQLSIHQAFRWIQEFGLAVFLGIVCHHLACVALHWGQRGYYPGGKLRVYWEFLCNIPSICPLGILRIFWRFISQFDLNIPSGQIESLIKENSPIYLWATHWKNPWVSFIN